MKTNFTMTKRFLLAITLLAVVVSSCSEDDPAPGVDISGIYAFGGAELIDGDVNNDATTDMLIIDGNYLLIGQPGDVTVSAGESQITSGFVNAVLRGAAPCTSDPVTAPWTYEINLKSGGILAFICTSESDLSEDLGTWQLLDNETTLSMTMTVSFSPVPIPITISGLTITETSVSGVIESLPMIKDAKLPIGAPLSSDPTDLNVQYISTKVTLTLVQ